MNVMSSGVVGLPPGPLTRAVLASMPADGHRYELIDGSLIVSPAPKIRHQDAVLGLYRVLLAASPADNKVLVAPVDVVLDDDTVIQPDVIVAPATDFTESDLPGPPLLAVDEIRDGIRDSEFLAGEICSGRGKFPAPGHSLPCQQGSDPAQFVETRTDDFDALSSLTQPL